MSRSWVKITAQSNLKKMFIYFREIMKAKKESIAETGRMF